MEFSIISFKAFTGATMISPAAILLITSWANGLLASVHATYLYSFEHALIRRGASGGKSASDAERFTPLGSLSSTGMESESAIVHEA